MTFNDPRKLLSPLATQWHNRSTSSLNSSTTYYSAQGQHPSPAGQKIELLPRKKKQSRSQIPVPSRSPSPEDPSQLTATKMARQDSGYCEGRRVPSPPLPKNSAPTTSTKRPSHTKRYSAPLLSSTAKAGTKRTAQAKSSTSSYRPSHNRSHTYNHPLRTMAPARPASQPYTFFQFPSLADDESASDFSHQESVTHQAPPPASTVYWTSEETRRLEYAAIDAASKGVKGLVARLIPACFVSEQRRRTKFSEEDQGSDCGSVRRYRLCMDEQEEKEEKGEREREREGKRAGLLPRIFRRWSGAGNKRR